MLHNWHYFIDILFPPTDDELRLRHHTPDTILDQYQPTVHNNVWALSSYHDPTVKAAITECKYRNNYHATSLLSALLRQWLHTQPTIPTLLIPLPLSTQRLRKRGYNQVEQVCLRVADLPHVTLLSKLLYRQRDTIPQTSLSRQDRLTNVKDAFAVHPTQLHDIQKYERIILCDDVVTTGATFTAAASALTPHIVCAEQLVCVSLAH